MQIERDPNGDFILQPADLAERFGLTGDDFRRKMQKGLLASTVEVGEGEDAGTCRLSLRLGNRLWRAILDSEDRVVSEEMTFVRGQLLRRPQGS